MSYSKEIALKKATALMPTTTTTTPIWKVFHLPIGTDELPRKVIITPSSNGFKRYEVWYGQELCWTERIDRSCPDINILKGLEYILSLAYSRNETKTRRLSLSAA